MRYRPRTLSVLAVFMCAVLAPGIVRADTESPWVKREFASFRLLAGAAAPGEPPSVDAALAFSIAPGWQLNGNDPGRFGVAPEMDWSASANLRGVDVHWPPPRRTVYSVDPPIATSGYHDSGLIPLRLVPAAPDAALNVSLKLTYAVCNDFCLVDEVLLALDLAPGQAPGPHADAIRETRAKIP